MNELIKQLREQAFDFVQQDLETVERDHVVSYPEHLEMVNAKFAELIVRECMACSTWVGKMNTNLVEPVHTAHAINQRIKQHFGVE